MSEKAKKYRIMALIFGFLGIINLTLGTSLFIFNQYIDNSEPLDDKEIVDINVQINNQTVIKDISDTMIEDTQSVVELIKNPKVMAYIKIPTYNQAKEGYILGCEGISLYMALRGLGYISDYSVDKFMATMPYGKTPFEGYVGNPKIGHYGENTNKRTTIYPGPLAKWAGNFATGLDLTGANVDTIKKELDQGHVVLVFVTSGWKNPKWKKYSWSTNSLGEIENNHCLCIVGYKSNGDFLVNDCHDGRVDGRQGEYWVNKEVFNSIYGARNYAVSVY